MLGRVSNLGRAKKGKYQGMQSRLVVAVLVQGRAIYGKLIFHSIPINR